MSRFRRPTIKKMSNHCWHWSPTSDVVQRPQERCCNCSKVIEDAEIWLTDTGECEWEYEED